MRSGLRSRIKTVEVKVEQLTKDVAETRIMAAKNDEDLAPFRQEMRAHVRVVTALRQTQLEQGKVLEMHGKILAKLTATTDQHTAKLDEHTAKLDEHTAKLDEHTAKLDEHTAKLDEHTAKLDQHTAKLDQHTAKLDQHTAKLDQHTAKLDQHTEQLGTLVAGQAKIMKHLGITEDDGDEPNGEP